MNSKPSEELSPQEQRALAALPRERAPRPELEERVVAALQARGLLHRHRPGGVRRWIGLAAGLAAAFLLGYWLGARREPEPPPQPPLGQWLLLLYENQGPWPADLTEADMPRIVEEYRSWARENAVGGERLELRGNRISLVAGEIDSQIVPGPEDALYLGGFFVIQAQNLEQARTIAETCPHLKYGGIIEIREIADMTE
ncbi:MAG: hypothetical protein EYC70_15655 [Planctomycetota bacterium]|nr:MAG: hypothetical protein EYC70_15655 [Planctomycetota bacterium]